MEILVYVVAIAISGWLMKFNLFKWLGKIVILLCSKTDDIIVNECDFDVKRMKENYSRIEEITNAYKELPKSGK